MATMKAVELTERGIRILDQTLLPEKVKYITCRNVRQVVDAIKRMKVRGAPMIGLTGVFALALEAKRGKGKLLPRLEEAARLLRGSRPTGRDLHSLTERMLRLARRGAGAEELWEEARLIEAEMIRVSERLGELGSKLIGKGQGVLTHCNTGFLAMPGKGTALAAIKRAWEEGKEIRVLVTETRPVLQGGRLTAWELRREGVPVTLIVDSAAGYCMREGMVDLVMVGADRILRDGSVINKVGTYMLAVLARENGIPFYVVAPTSTLDPGRKAEIEERDPEEVLGIYRSDPGVEVFNPAFDFTPAHLVTRIVTEEGIFTPRQLRWGR